MVTSAKSTMLPVWPAGAGSERTLLDSVPGAYAPGFPVLTDGATNFRSFGPKACLRLKLHHGKTHSLPRPLTSTRIAGGTSNSRSEEHTSELQSRGHLVCRLLLEKKKI